MSGQNTNTYAHHPQYPYYFVQYGNDNPVAMSSNETGGYYVKRGNNLPPIYRPWLHEQVAPTRVLSDCIYQTGGNANVCMRAATYAYKNRVGEQHRPFV